MKRDRKYGGGGEYQVFDNSGLKEPDTAFAPPVGEKIHVDVYLKVKGVPLWERGGKRAFAITKGKELATERELDTLFSSY
jgi:hypothetical protein